MAEIKKINGNTLCDDVARTAADAAQETAEDAAKVADVAINNLTGIAKMAEYDGDNKQLLAKKYNTSGGTTNTVLAAPGVAQLTTITVGDKAYAVQSSAWDNVVATYSGEDGLHVLSGKFTSTFGKEVELTETVVPYSAQVQADWNESDPTSPAYIQNRIGGYKRSEAERLVEYDETTAEYIDVDVTGSGTALRYRKASDTLVDKEDWYGAKIVISISGDDATFGVGITEGADATLELITKTYDEGEVSYTSFFDIVCGIIAPQETTITVIADEVSVQAGDGYEDYDVYHIIIPEGVWVLDLPWFKENIMDNDSGESESLALAKVARSALYDPSGGIRHESITLAEYKYIGGEKIGVTAYDYDADEEAVAMPLQDALDAHYELIKNVGNAANNAWNMANTAQATADGWKTEQRIEYKYTEGVPTINAVASSGGTVVYHKIGEAPSSVKKDYISLKFMDSKATYVPDGYMQVGNAVAVVFYKVGTYTIQLAQGRKTFTDVEPGVYVQDGFETYAVEINVKLVSSIPTAGGYLDFAKNSVKYGDKELLLTAGNGISIEDGVIALETPVYNLDKLDDQLTDLSGNPVSIAWMENGDKCEIWFSGEKFSCECNNTTFSDGKNITTIYCVGAGGALKYVETDAVEFTSSYTKRENVTDYNDDCRVFYLRSNSGEQWAVTVSDDGELVVKSTTPEEEPE